MVQTTPVVIKRWSVPLGLAALVLVLGFPALSQYGVTWDEALGDFFFGERYLDFFLSFDQRYLDFAADPYPPGHRPDLSGSPFRNRPWEYYPVANVLAAATSRVLSGELGWLDPFDGFHAVNLFLGAALIASLYVYVRRRFDSIAALVAAVLLFTSPRIVADLCSNLKDTPEMVFFALTLLAFAAAFDRGSALGVAASGVLWGLALGTKANALFLPAIVLVTVLIATRPPAWRGRSAALWTALASFVAVGLATAFVLWPYLWGAPFARVREHLQYVGLRIFSTRPESVISPLAAIVYTTPLPFLGLSIAGIAIAAREVASRRREARYVLPLAWIAVVLVRLHLPGAVNFDGVRHFLELFPPLAILGGVAASRLAAWVRGAPAAATVTRRAASAVLVALLLAPSLAAIARVHPFELAYWNALAGRPRRRAREAAGASRRLLGDQLPHRARLAERARAPRHGARRAAGAAHRRHRRSGEAAVGHRADRSAPPDLAAASSRVRSAILTQPVEGDADLRHVRAARRLAQRPDPRLPDAPAAARPLGGGRRAGPPDLSLDSAAGVRSVFNRRRRHGSGSMRFARLSTSSRPIPKHVR